MSFEITAQRLNPGFCCFAAACPGARQHQVLRQPEVFHLKSLRIEPLGIVFDLIAQRAFVAEISPDRFAQRDRHAHFEGCPRIRLHATECVQIGQHGIAILDHLDIGVADQRCGLFRRKILRHFIIERVEPFEPASLAQCFEIAAMDDGVGAKHVEACKVNARRR